MARLISPRRAAALVALLLLSLAPRLATAGDAGAASLDRITVSMGYIPNVQFAPFYVAAARGYYAAAKLEVTFDYAQSPDIIKLVASGDRTFGNADGDQVIVGRAHGLAVESVLTQYQRFPVVIFALQSSHIRSFADLKGKSIGIPGLYGASYTGLLAALQAAHLSTKDVKIVSINYTQVAQVAQHQVDAAVGYAMNEPIQLQHLGYKVTVLPLANQANLAGAGIVTSQSLIQKQPELVRRFVQATYRGLQDAIANPQTAFTVSRAYIKGLSANQVSLQLAVLREAVKYWAPPVGQHLGCGTTAQWAATQAALLSQHQISKPVGVGSVFTNTFVPSC